MFLKSNQIYIFNFIFQSHQFFHHHLNNLNLHLKNFLKDYLGKHHRKMDFQLSEVERD